MADVYMVLVLRVPRVCWAVNNARRPNPALEVLTGVLGPEEEERPAPSLSLATQHLSLG